MKDEPSTDFASGDLVSILIPVYNAEEYISQSIKSCVDQTYCNIEIIVINDGSIDNSKKEIIKSMNQYKNVRLIDIKHSGKVQALNAGIKYAKGRYIAIHAADDVCFNYRISEQVKILNENRKACLVFGDMEITDDRLNILCDSYWREENIEIPSLRYSEKLLWGNFISGGTMLFKREIINKVFPIPGTLQFEDWWIAFIASFYGEIKYTKKRLIKYRQHLNNENAKYNVTDLKLLVEKQKKLLHRNFEYYNEFEKFINTEVHNINDKNRYINIINSARLISILALTHGFMKRMEFSKQIFNKYIFCCGFRNFGKIVFYTVIGDKVLFIKYRIKLMKRRLTSNEIKSNIAHK